MKPQICNSIEMAASPQEVFEVVSDLVNWPKYLPHYRWVRLMEKQPNYQVLSMACYRKWIPLEWISRFYTDSTSRKLYFHHIGKVTRGMEVVWNLEPIGSGTTTQVTITHELQAVKKRLGAFISEKFIGEFLITFVATQTLKHFALHFKK